MLCDGNQFFLLLNSLGVPSFGGTPNLTYIRSFAFSFFFTFFQSVQFWLCWTIGVQHFKERGERIPCIIFCYFWDFKKNCEKKNIEQSSWRRSNQIRLQMKQPHHHDLGLCGGKCHIFPKPRRQIWCGYFSIIEGLIV